LTFKGARGGKRGVRRKILYEREKPNIKTSVSGEDNEESSEEKM